MDEKPPKVDCPPPVVSRQVDVLCDRFEAALKQGKPPDIEAYLAEVGQGERNALRSELRALEQAYRRPPDTNARTTKDAIGDGPDSSTSTVSHDPAQLRGGPAGTTDELPGGPEALLATTWPFSELPETLTRILVDEMRRKRFERGEALLEQGQPCPHLLLLLDGETEVRVEHDEGSHEIAETHGATILGEMSLLSGAPCSATVVATSPVNALALPAAQFHHLAARFHALWLALGLLTAERLGRRAIDILAGKVLGGYRIRRCIGRGGMAMVYQAEQLDSGETVALKMLSHRFCNDLEAQSRFEREVKICRTLRHPHIARVYDSFTAFGTNFMVVDYCEGETLDEMIRRRGSLPEDRVRAILGQLAAALAYAHAQGVCHRDLKPSNVMVGPDGHVMLMDFGLAKSTCAPEMTIHGQIIGTPRYMPPEQLSGNPVDHRADLYALGSIAYEMLSGRPLFPQRDNLAILSQQLTWSLPPAAEIRPDLSDDLYEVLRQSLARVPEQRVLDLTHLARWAEQP